MAITHRVGNTRNLTAAEVDANFDTHTTAISANAAAITTGLAGKLSNAAGQVPLASLPTQTTKTYLGRTTAGTGVIESVPVATLRTDLGILDASSIAYSATIPLDNAAGKRMPQTVISTNTSFVLGASPVTDGYCEVVVVGDGTHTLSFPSDWTRAVGSAPNMAANKRSYIGITYLAIGEVVYSVTPLSDVAGGLTFGAVQVANATPTVIRITMSGTIGAIVPAVGDVTVPGFTVSSVAAVGAELQITVSTAFTWQTSTTVAVASGKVGTVGNVLSTASGTLSITNNVTMPVPGIPTTLLEGTPGTTTMPLTWVAPAVNSTQGNITDYIVEWRTAGVGGYSVFSDGVSTTASATVSGLTAGTSYDFRVKATNATGDGSYSSVRTVSTTSSRITFTDSFTGANGDTPNARWTQLQSGWTIQSNELSYNGGSYGTIVADCTAGDNDLSVSVPHGVGGSSYMTLTIRYVDSSNSVYVIRNGGNSESIDLVSYTAGVPTVIGSSPDANFGLAHTLRVTSSGSTIKVYLSGVEVISATIASHSTATKIGLSLNNSHSADTIDNCVLA